MLQVEREGEREMYKEREHPSEIEQEGTLWMLENNLGSGVGDPMSFAS